MNFPFASTQQLRKIESALRNFAWRSRHLHGDVCTLICVPYSICALEHLTHQSVWRYGSGSSLTKRNGNRRAPQKNVSFLADRSSSAKKKPSCATAISSSGQLPDQGNSVHYWLLRAPLGYRAGNELRIPTSIAGHSETHPGISRISPGTVSRTRS